MNDPKSIRPQPARTHEPRDIENELAQLRRQHESVLDAIGDGIQGLDADGKILFENPSAARLLGRAPGELLGQSVRETMCHSHPNESTECPIDATFRDGRARRVRGDLFRRKDGSGFPVDYSVTPMENERGKMTGALIVFRDATETKKHEAQSVRARRIESIGKLAGGVAHDMGNALNPIFMAVDLFKRKVSDPGDIELLEIIETSARRGTEMVRQMVSFADGIEGRRVIIHPAQLLREIEKIVGATFPKSITVATSATEELPALRGDPAELHDALLHLCTNARATLTGGGTLTLTATHAHLDAGFAAENPPAQPGHFIVIEVAESSAAQEVSGRMCLPFFEMGKAAQTARIGLTTAHAIVKSHGGFILVENESERGKIFRIHLPAEADDAHRISPTAP